jgi:hypothetical protein
MTFINSIVFSEGLNISVVTCTRCLPSNLQFGNLLESVQSNDPSINVTIFGSNLIAVARSFYIFRVTYAYILRTQHVI